jgi:hypothetical protein
MGRATEVPAEMRVYVMMAADGLPGGGGRSAALPRPAVLVSAVTGVRTTPHQTGGSTGGRLDLDPGPAFAGTQHNMRLQPLTTSGAVIRATSLSPPAMTFSAPQQQPQQLTHRLQIISGCDSVAVCFTLCWPLCCAAAPS